MAKNIELYYFTVILFYYFSCNFVEQYIWKLTDNWNNHILALKI